MQLLLDWLRFHLKFVEKRFIVREVREILKRNALRAKKYPIFELVMLLCKTRRRQRRSWHQIRDILPFSSFWAKERKMGRCTQKHMLTQMVWKFMTAWQEGRKQMGRLRNISRGRITFVLQIRRCRRICKAAEGCRLFQILQFSARLQKTRWNLRVRYACRIQRSWQLCQSKEISAAQFCCSFNFC